MNTIRITAVALLTCLLLPGCGKSDTASAPDSGKEPTTLLGKAVKGATDGAREELSTGNIDLDAGGYPKAEITPSGAFLIDGKAVATNAEQKALLLAYRTHVAAIAAAGIGLGLEGADLAGKAVSEAIKGVFTGNTDQIDRKIEAEAEGIKTSAQKLCALLPGLKATQDKLAATLPEFKPYTKMDESDLKECIVDNGKSYDAGKDVGRAISRAIKGDRADNAGNMNAAEEAEAAGATP